MKERWKRKWVGYSLKGCYAHFFITLVLSIGRPKRVLAADTAEVKGTVSLTNNYSMAVPDSVVLHLF